MCDRHFDPIDEMEKKEAERRAVDERKHAEELHFLKRTNQQLKVNYVNISTFIFFLFFLFFFFLFIRQYVIRNVILT